MQVPLAKPKITEKDREAVLEVLKTSKISLGPKLEEFEQKIANYAGVKYAVAVNSGTSALHLIVKALGIGEGDEVITTPFTFISSANCVLFEGAKPVFSDIDTRTLNIEPEKVEEKVTERTKAILAVDVFGQPANWDRLERIAEDNDLFLIDDSAEALGAERKSSRFNVQSSRLKTEEGSRQGEIVWKKAGSFGDAGVFAFYPNKQITTGEGGMVVTNNERIARLARSFRNQGRAEGDSWLQHERLGYNYRLSDINCALGISQLERIDEIVEKRKEVAELYNSKLRKVDEIRTPYVSSDVKMSWFVYVVRLSEEFSREDRNEIIEGLSKKGIGAANYFAPIHLQPFYREKFGYKEGDFPVTESVGIRTIALPFYNDLTEEKIEYVVDRLKEVVYRKK